MLKAETFASKLLRVVPYDDFPENIKKLIMIRLTLLLVTLLLNACVQNNTAQTKPSVVAETDRALIRQDKLADTRRIALIIGNSDYAGGFSGTSLKNPVNDAKDLAKKLKKLNFSLVNNKALLDANKQQIERAVKQFTQELKQGSLGLFFYAGHGMQIDGVNYLIPLDAEFKSKADVKYNAVNLNWVLAELESAKNPVNFILLDACRDNPFRGFRSSQKGLAESRAPEGSLISFATGPGKVASDGLRQHNSPYTKALLTELDKPGIEVLSLFKAVRRNVRRQTRNQQTPWESHSLTEDVYFNGSPKDRVAEQQQVLQQLSEIRKQQQATELQLQQALKQQQQAQGSEQKETADIALQQAREAAQRIRTQAQKIGVTINPTALEGSSTNEFEIELLIQQQKFVLAQNAKMDSADYTKAKSEHSSAAYLNYLKNCASPCAYSETAETAYKHLQAQQDKKSYQQASKKNSSRAYRHYLENCNIICAYQQVAEQNLKISKQTEQQILQDSEYYAQARKIDTVPALAAYLNSCKVCMDAKKINKHWKKQQIELLPDTVLQRLAQFNVQFLSGVLNAKVISRKDRFAGEMNTIRPGCFQMGSHNGYYDEKPVHKVCIAQSYELGKFEVTQAQWQKIMGNNPSQFKGNHNPVESVSWNDVQSFIRKLNQKTGKNYRLPTEAEWAYACRSGGKDQEYCGSKNINEVGHPSLLGLHFHFINNVIPEVFYRESSVHDGFLLEACRNDGGLLKKV